MWAVVTFESSDALDACYESINPFKYVHVSTTALRIRGCVLSAVQCSWSNIGKIITRTDTQLYPSSNFLLPCMYNLRICLTDINHNRNLIPVSTIEAQLIPRTFDVDP